MRRIIVVFCFVLVAAVPAGAQDRPVTFNLGFGATWPIGDVADSFDAGWNFVIGGQFNISENVGFLVDYQYHRMGGPDRVFDNDLPPFDPILIESNHQMHMGTFDLIFRTPQRGVTGGYFLVGPGVYNRKVQLTTPSVGVTTVCDPYWTSVSRSPSRWTRLSATDRQPTSASTSAAA